MITEIHIFDIDEMRRCRDTIPGNARIVSCIDPEEEDPPYEKETDRVIILRFDDIELFHLTDEMRARFKRAGFLPPDEAVFFTDEMADRVIEFVMDCMDGRERIPIYVHCHAGFSRSPTIARFIADLTGIEHGDINRYGKPWGENKFVADKLRERYRLRVMP